MQIDDKEKSVALRPYPFPFRAALAVSNDTDGMDWAAFEDWHAFVNGTDQTPYGTGLGLEIGDSFWLWSDTGAFALRHAAPWDETGVASPESDRIAELVRLGWLDTLHSFGDWDPHYQLSVRDIDKGVELLRSLDLYPAVYVNHGGGGFRQHNIGGVWSSYQSGDDPESPAYNLGKLLDSGFRYFWTDQLFENDKFGEEYGEEWIDWRRGYRPHKWRHVGLRLARDEKSEKRDVFADLPAPSARLICEYLSDNILIPNVGRDDRQFLSFKRFRGRDAPNSANFALQVSHHNLNLLEEGQGVVIVYQHFGVWRALGRYKGHSSTVESRRPLLDDNTVWAFRELARRQSEGRLFVTTTGRLLDYLWARDALRFQVTVEAEGIQIELLCFDCPVHGRSDVDLSRLQGIAFLVPSTTGAVTVKLPSGEQLTGNRQADPVHREMDSIFFPWKRLVFPTFEGTIPPSISATRRSSTPPFQERPVTFKAPSSTHLSKLVGLFARKVKDDTEQVQVRDDLEKIRDHWQDIRVPAVYSAAESYANKMHDVPFVDYLRRIQKLNGGGSVVLDAGSGTSTWSFALSEVFDRVIAVDKNRPRVDLARWLVKWSGNNRIDVHHGDVTNLDLPTNSVDFVFCYGVVISVLPLRVVLREFQRVTKPGGYIYVCVNGIGWSYYLRDERGAKNKSNEVQGRRGIYNTLAQTRHGDVNELVPAFLTKIVEDGAARDAVRSSLTMSDGEFDGFLQELLQVVNVTELSFANAGGDVVLEVSRRLDVMFVAAGFSTSSFVETAKIVEEECGPELQKTFGGDLLNLFSGRKDTFSFANAGRAYTPEEVQEICDELGLQDFQWAGDGQLVGPGGADQDVRSMFEAQYSNKLGVWEFMVRKPTDDR